MFSIVQFRSIGANGIGLCVRCLCALDCVWASNDAKPVLAAVFFYLIFSKLENNLKISLKKFAKSKKKRCIFV